MFGRKFRLSGTTHGIPTADLEHRSAGKARRSYRLTTPYALGVECRPVATSHLAVAHVLDLGSQVQVVGADARSIVTVVETHQSRWNGSVCEFVGNAMGQRRGHPKPAPVEHAVPKSVAEPGPRPAAIGFTPIHSAPEATGHRINWFRSGLWAICAERGRSQQLTATVRRGEPIQHHFQDLQHEIAAEWVELVVHQARRRSLGSRTPGFGSDLARQPRTAACVARGRARSNPKPCAHIPRGSTPGPCARARDQSDSPTSRGWSAGGLEPCEPARTHADGRGRTARPSHPRTANRRAGHLPTTAGRPGGRA